MTVSVNLQLLTYLLVCSSCAHAIMVKFGTKGGPIVPPTPEPVTPPPRPGRSPAPVWEERTNDEPDPNANWRPQLFIPQPRYTQIIFGPPAPSPQTNAQRFVNQYVPQNQPTQHKPIPAPPITNYFTPTQFLSSQNLPGIGIRYFAPTYINHHDHQQESHIQEDAKHNQIETNDVAGGVNESGSDLQWKYEKDATKRSSRRVDEGTPALERQYVYQWPAYVLRHN